MRVSIDVWAERPGWFRAFWVKDPGTGSPVIGYCSPGGSHRTIRGVVAEVSRMYPQEPIYRNGRLICEGGKA